MQTKLTISIEHSIAKQAKQYAKERKRSLSEIIEDYLKIILQNKQHKIKLSPPIEKMKGSIKLPDDFDYKKELSKSISERHLA